MNWRCRSATSRRSPLVSSRNRRWPARAWPDSRIVHFSSARRTKAAIPDLRGDINGLNCFMETVPAHCNIRIMAGRGPLLGAPVKLPRARRGNAMLWPEKKAGKTGISESFKRYPPPDGISGGLFGNFQPVKGHFYGDIKKAAKPFGFAAFFIMLFPILPDGKYFLCDPSISFILPVQLCNTFSGVCFISQKGRASTAYPFQQGYPLHYFIRLLLTDVGNQIEI